MGQHVFKAGMKLGAMLKTCIHPFAVVVMQLHIEGLRPPGHCLANAPHAENAEPASADVEPKWSNQRRGRPSVLPHHAVAPACAPCGTQHEQQCNIRGGVGKYIGRIGNCNVSCLRRRDVDMVGADRECCNHAYGGRQGIDDIGPALEHGGYQKCVKVLRLENQLRSAYHAVRRIQLSRKVAGKPGLHFDW